MKYKDWSDFKVHCSGISRIMSRPKGYNDLNKRDRDHVEKLSSKIELDDSDKEKIIFYKEKRERFLNPPLSAAAKKYLVDRYSVEKYNIRRASAGGTQQATINKGVALETEGIELLSKLDGVTYVRPDEKAENDYIIGKCDILCAKTKIVDIKTSWNGANFMANHSEKLGFSAWSQLQGYLDVYDLEYGQVCYVLVNTPIHLVDQERANLFRKYSFGEITKEKYDTDLERFDSIFDYNKIPITKRVIKFDVYRSEDFLKAVRNKVVMCREFLGEFERVFMNNKTIVTSAEDYTHAKSTEEDNSEYQP